MITLSQKQQALMRLPDPSSFLPKLTWEMRQDFTSGTVPRLTDTQLLNEVQSSYQHAVYELGITRLATLVKWVKADVAGGGELRRDMNIDQRLRQANNPNAAAEDFL
ncbi:hypothetical protein HX776_18360, partial [Pseudomonas agarici]